MTMRFFVAGPLVAGQTCTLPPGATRHAQVRRVQPGETLVLFDGGGCDWPATVLAVGRSAVEVHVGEPRAVDREAPVAVTLAVVMPANDRMDALVEKATELGVAAIQPLQATRSVLRLAGERAERKRAHWQAIAEAACEQCGRARVPPVAPVQELAAWLPQAPAVATKLLLSLGDGAVPLTKAAAHARAVVTLSGPEGGFTPEEDAAARAAGFAPVALGPRVLRADTAPLAVLAWLSLQPRPSDG